MHLHTRNVNTAFRDILEGFYYEDTGRSRSVAWGNVPFSKVPSRNGNVFKIDEPMTITYSHPRERVLFNEARDANPFFHLYHSLWMLAGRNDLAPVQYYVGKMKEFSDDGKTLNGAYGYRWRNGWSQNDLSQHDQLDLLVSHLANEPTSRRAVLQMWNVEDDLLKIGSKCTWSSPQGIEHCDEGTIVHERDSSNERPCSQCNGTGKIASKDVCCNLSVLFSIRPSERVPGEAPEGWDKYLDMTVLNRSNDLVWGMLGEDFVTFSILQEYIAARLDVEVGKYHHISNNLHVYDWNWKPEEWLRAEKHDGKLIRDQYDSMGMFNRETPGMFKLIPLIGCVGSFDKEVSGIVNEYSSALPAQKGATTHYTNEFLTYVATPMLQAYGCHKSNMPGRALEWANQIRADDWRIACVAWLKRRIGRVSGDRP